MFEPLTPPHPIPPLALVLVPWRALALLLQMLHLMLLGLMLLLLLLPDGCCSKTRKVPQSVLLPYEIWHNPRSSLPGICGEEPYFQSFISFS